MRDFLVSKKQELKFVFNFHSLGRMVVMPINAKPGNALR